jgi:hypothetical protein
MSQHGINERDNLHRSSNSAPKFSNRARLISLRFESRLSHGGLVFWASHPPTTGRLGERSMTNFASTTTPSSASRYVACSIYHYPASSPLFASPLLVLLANCHLSLQAIRGAIESTGVDMSDDALATAFADHLARCGCDASVHTVHFCLVAALAEIISEVRGALGVGVESLTDTTMLVQLPNGSDGLPEDVVVLHYHGIRGSKVALDAVVSGSFGLCSPPSPSVAISMA